MVDIFSKRVDLTAKNAEQVSATKRPWIPRGRSWKDRIFVTDEEGNAYNLGPTDDPNWTFAAQLRDRPKRLGGKIIASMTVTPIDGPTGELEVVLTPSSTASSRFIRGYWDFEMTNISDIDFNPGWEVAPAYGKFLMQDDVTVV